MPDDTPKQVERFQLQGNAPELYEASKVPSLFRPLAEGTLEAVQLAPGDRVLDVACGTGIVGRLIADKLADRLGDRLSDGLGDGGTVTGIDLNGGMIAKAREMHPADISWEEGDVTAMPFDDGAFDIAFCQQGLQFFPDKAAALAEIRRVLAPGGRLALTVWCNISDYIAALSDALRSHVSEKAATQARAPFTFDDRMVIEGLVESAGFSGITTTVLEVPRTLGPGDGAIALDMAGTPYTAELEAAGPDAVARVVTEVAGRIAAYGDGPSDVVTYAVPQRAHLVQARVSG